MTAPAKPAPDPKPEGPKPPAPSPIAKAIADVRAQLKPEDEKGKGAAEEDEGAKGATGTEAGETGEAAPAAGKQGEAEGTQAGEGGEAGGKGGEAGGEGEGGEAAEQLVVEIPARREGDEPLKLAVDDEETADRLRQLVRGNLRRENLHREREGLEAQHEELAAVERHLELDPVGFIVEHVKGETQVELAKHLLSIPEVFQAVSQELEAWQDPDHLARRQAELRADRQARERDTDRQLRSIEQARAEGRRVRATVETLVPAEMDDDEAAMFRDDCLGDVAAYARAHPDVRSLRPEEVVRILDRRLRHHGLTPESALAALSSGQPPRRATAASRSTAPAPGPLDEHAARTTGTKLKQAGDQRRAAAAVPGAGAGAQPAKLEPPAQQGVKERIAFVRKLLKQ